MTHYEHAEAVVENADTLRLDTVNYRSPEEQTQRYIGGLLMVAHGSLLTMLLMKARSYRAEVANIMDYTHCVEESGNPSVHMDCRSIYQDLGIPVSRVHDPLTDSVRLIPHISQADASTLLSKLDDLDPAALWDRAQMLTGSIVLLAASAAVSATLYLRWSKRLENEVTVVNPTPELQT